MTPNTLVLLIHNALPHLSVLPRAILDALLLTQGSIGSAGKVALHLGLRDRFEVAQILRRDGLPPLHDLAAWVSILNWVDRAECTGSSLCQLAFSSRRDPAVCYRTVKRITRTPWHEVKRHGVAWVAERFVERCNGVPAPRLRPPRTQPRRPLLARAAP